MIKNLEEMAKKLQMASDPSRMRIICAIMDGNRACVSDIAKRLDLSVAIVSHHLQALAQEGLIKPEREGKMICYQIEKTEFMKDLKGLICKYK